MRKLELLLLCALFLVSFSIYPKFRRNSIDYNKSVVRHVIHIGIDGLKSSCLLNVTGGANNILFRLGAQGSCTLTNGRTAIETISAPGWCAHLCSLDSSDSGIFSNSWVPPWQPYNQNVLISPVTGVRDSLPTVFKTIKMQDPSIRTAMYYDWGWLAYLGNASIAGTLDLEYYCDPAKYNGRELCDFYIYGNVTQYLNDTLKNNTKSYTFIYFGNLDEVGHEKAWCSEDYEQEIHRIDNYIGGILDLVDLKNAFSDTLIVLSTDHGGEPGGFNHGYRDDNCVIVPIFFRGPRIKKNHVIKYKIHVMDIAPTALYAMGLSPNCYWQGQINLDIFE